MTQNIPETCCVKINLNFVLCVADLGKHVWEITKFTV